MPSTRTEEQLPLALVSETDLTVAEGVLYFGREYVRFLRSCRRPVRARRGVAVPVTPPLCPTGGNFPALLADQAI